MKEKVTYKIQNFSIVKKKHSYKLKIKKIKQKIFTESLNTQFLKCRSAKYEDLFLSVCVVQQFALITLLRLLDKVKIVLL